MGLSWGWGGNQRKAVSRVEGGGHLVEGAGGEVAQQALETVDRATIGGEFAGALAQRGGRGLGGGEGWAGATIEGCSRAPGSSSSNRIGLRRSRMCHSTWQASRQRKTWARTRGVSQWWIGRRYRSRSSGCGRRARRGQGPCSRRSHCRPPGLYSRHWCGGHKNRRAGLRRRSGRVADKGEAVLGNSDVEQLGELLAVLDAADGAGDLVLAFGAAAAGDLVGQLGQCRLGGLQQILALAGTFLGQLAGSCRRPAARRETRGR